MSLRVFSPTEFPQLDAGSVVELDQEEGHYLVRVRRAEKGQLLELLDGRGSIFEAKLVAFERGARSVKVELLRPLPVAASTPKRTLLLGTIDRNACLEALVDATVMGASELVWVDCARSQSGPPGAARVERALRAAQRQCGRADRPTLSSAASLREAVEQEPGAPLVWASLAPVEALGDDSNIPTPPHLNAAVRLAIGPEGGFDPSEVAFLRERGAYPLRLGPWVLRSERAVVAGLAKLFPGAST
jgi:16S rRNA (uracil1498-N3)-methyltransferase